MSENQNPGASLGGGIPQALKELLRRYEKSCSDMEALAEDRTIFNHCERAAALKEEFAALPPLPDEFSELLNQRFVSACSAAEIAAAKDEEHIKEAEKLRKEAAAILAAGDFATLAEINALKNRWNNFFGNSDAAAAEWNSLLGDVEAGLISEENEKIRRGSEAEKLTAELNSLVEAGDPEQLKNRRAEIESAYAALGNVPKPYSTSYQDALRKAQSMLARHFETLDYARWESYTLKLDLLKELEKLQETPDNIIGSIAKQLTAIHDKWKQLGSVPKEKADEVNPRFLELTRTLQHRVDEFFSNRRQEQKISAEEKEKLCQEAECNSERTDWGAASAAFRELQAKWKVLPRAGAKEAALFSRFRAAADKFFNARNEVFAERDRRFAQAATAKRSLIESIATITDVRKAKNLRAEYNAIGNAGREENEIYKAFNAAMDKFFADRNAAFAAKEKEASALIAELEGIAASETPSAERAREIRKRFDELNCRKLARAMEKAESAFAAARKEASKQAASRRWSDYQQAAKCAAELLATPDAEIPDELAKFPKLCSSLELARLAATDDKIAKQWEKQLAATRKEYKRIKENAESIAGKKKMDSAPVDLAAELQSAIMGNFARKEAESLRPKVDAATLRQEATALGVMPAEELLPLLDLLTSI